MIRLLSIALFLALSLPAMAAGWTVERVRGEAAIEVRGGWQPVQVGLVIGNGSKLRTGASGRVDIARGNDRFSLGANTSVQVQDAGPQLMTSIIQSSGEVSVDVERRNVQHFSVQTPFLAAVVKGTKFTVIAARGSSHVEVDRGVVQVQDSSNDLVANVQRGQEASVSAEKPLSVEGPGPKQVFTTGGVPVTPGNPPAAGQSRPVPGDAPKPNQPVGHAGGPVGPHTSDQPAPRVGNAGGSTQPSQQQHAGGGGGNHAPQFANTGNGPAAMSTPQASAPSGGNNGGANRDSDRDRGGPGGGGGPGHGHDHGGGPGPGPGPGPGGGGGHGGHDGPSGGGPGGGRR